MVGRPPCQTRAETSLVVVPVSWLERLPDLLALRTDRELLRRPARHPDLAAQRHDRGAHDHRLGELVLVDVVAETLVVALVGGDRAFLDALFDSRVGQRGETGGNHRT